MYTRKLRAVIFKTINSMINRIGSIILVGIGIYALFGLKNTEGAILCYCMAIYGLVLDIHIKKVKE